MLQSYINKIKNLNICVNIYLSIHNISCPLLQYFQFQVLGKDIMKPPCMYLTLPFSIFCLCFQYTWHFYFYLAEILLATLFKQFPFLFLLKDFNSPMLKFYVFNKWQFLAPGHLYFFIQYSFVHCYVESFDKKPNTEICNKFCLIHDGNYSTVLRKIENQIKSSPSQQKDNAKRRKDVLSLDSKTFQAGLKWKL